MRPGGATPDDRDARAVVVTGVRDGSSCAEARTGPSREPGERATEWNVG